MHGFSTQLLCFQLTNPVGRLEETESGAWVRKAGFRQFPLRRPRLARPSVGPRPSHPSSKGVPSGSQMSPIVLGRPA